MGQDAWGPGRAMQRRGVAPGDTVHLARRRQQGRMSTLEQAAGTDPGTHARAHGGRGVTAKGGRRAGQRPSHSLPHDSKSKIIVVYRGFVHHCQSLQATQLPSGRSSRPDAGTLFTPKKEMSSQVMKRHAGNGNAC